MKRTFKHFFVKLLRKNAKGTREMILKILTTNEKNARRIARQDTTSGANYTWDGELITIKHPAFSLSHGEQEAAGCYVRTWPPEILECREWREADDAHDISYARNDLKIGRAYTDGKNIFGD